MTIPASMQDGLPDCGMSPPCGLITSMQESRLWLTDRCICGVGTGGHRSFERLSLCFNCERRMIQSRASITMRFTCGTDFSAPPPSSPPLSTEDCRHRTCKHDASFSRQRVFDDPCRRESAWPYTDDTTQGRRTSRCGECTHSVVRIGLTACPGRRTWTWPAPHAPAMVAERVIAERNASNWPS